MAQLISWEAAAHCAGCLAVPGSGWAWRSRVVVAGLTLIVISGLLMLAADLDTFLHSRVFWIKMTLIVLLLINGALLTAAPATAPGAPLEVVVDEGAIAPKFTDTQAQAVADDATAARHGL